MYLKYHVIYLNISWNIGILYTPSRHICWVMTGHQWKLTSRVDNRWTANNVTISYFITTIMLTSGHLMYRVTKWWQHERLCQSMKAPEQTEQQLLATDQVLYPSYNLLLVYEVLTPRRRIRTRLLHMSKWRPTTTVGGVRTAVDVRSEFRGCRKRWAIKCVVRSEPLGHTTSPNPTPSTVAPARCPLGPSWTWPMPGEQPLVSEVVIPRYQMTKQVPGIMSVIYHVICPIYYCYIRIPGISHALSDIYPPYMPLDIDMIWYIQKTDISGFSGWIYPKLYSPLYSPGYPFLSQKPWSSKHLLKGKKSHKVPRT